MKKLFTTVAICVTLFAHAQNNGGSEKKGTHNGVQVSLYSGATFGDVKETTINSGIFFYKGPVMHTMIQIGYAFNDWALGFTYCTNSLEMQTMSFSDSDYSIKPGWTMDNSLMGVYVKKYFMPINIFASFETGVGSYTIYDPDLNPAQESDDGVAWNITAGKEFLIGKKKRWGLGLYMNIGGLTTSKEKVNDTYSYLAPGLGVAISFH